MKGGHKPYDPNLSVENHLRNDTARPGDRAQGTQTKATSTNTANFNGQTSFQNPPRSVTSTNGPTGPSNNRYSQPPNKGPGKKTSKHNLNYTQPSTSSIFTQPSSYPQSRNLGTGQPKMFCTTCGEYNHWRKDCPYDCHCDNCDSDSHATHMCRAPPKPSPNPSPQPLICIYCGSSDHRPMECSNHPRDNREEGCAPSPAPNQYNCEKQQKSALASGKNSQKPNGKLKNNDKPRTSGENSQKSKAGRQCHQQQQCPTQGKQNHNSFPYRDYRYHKQPRQTRFNEKQKPTIFPLSLCPFTCTICRI